MTFIHDVSTITEDFQPAPAQSTSNEGTNTSAKFVNRPDLAEGCTILTEECNYKATLDFLDNFEAWYPATFPGCADMNIKKAELYNKLSRHLKTELVSFNTSTHNFEDLKKAIMDRNERKLPLKIRLLTFLTETKQRNDQTLFEYFAVSLVSMVIHHW